MKTLEEGIVHINNNSLILRRNATEKWFFKISRQNVIDDKLVIGI